MQARNRSAKTWLLPALQKSLAVCLISAGSLVLSPTAAALGLGDLTLSSTLNEPLRASIVLDDLDGLDLIDLNIRLGGVEDYEQAGLQRDALLNDLSFEVLGESGRGVVVITSSRNINEPFLNLILIASWPSGRLVREYTILLDLPGTATANTAATLPSPAISAVVPAPGAVNATPASGTYTVQTGDTLYQIAEKTRPGNDVSVRQMMIALQRSNEDAFVNNNINRIITGRVLRIPPMQEIRLIDQEAANAQVTAQNQALAVQPLSGPGEGNAGDATRDELTLLSGDSDNAAGSSDLEATIAALQNELMLSEENLDRARLENTELTARLASLDEEIALLQNIIAIEDERLAQLQADLAAQAEAAARMAAAAQATSNSAGNATGGRPEGLVGQITGALQSNLVSLAAVLVLVLLILGFLVVRRRRAEAVDAEGFDLDAFEDVASQAPAARVAESDLGSAHDEEDAGAAVPATGLLGGLLARFRRSKPEEEDGVDEALESFADDMEEEPAADQLSEESVAEEAGEARDHTPVEFELTEEEVPQQETAEAQPEVETAAASADDILEMEDQPVSADSGPEIESADILAQEVEADVPESGLVEIRDTDDALDALESALDEIEGFSFDEEAGVEAEPEIEFDLDEAPVAAPHAGAESGEDEDDILTAALDAVDFDEPEDGQADIPAAGTVSPADEAEASARAVDFNVAPVEQAPEAEAEDAGGDAEVFEFSLSEPEPAAPAEEHGSGSDVETFAFALKDEKPAENAVEEELEVISFDTVEIDPQAVASPAAVEESAEEADSEAFEEITFDDSMLLDDGDAEGGQEEESVYIPRTNMDECDTKLDLAVAYEAMGDVEGAIEILDEVIADGNEKQVGQARKLKAQWQGS
jgi:pilus assembly protein FimV